MSELKAYVCGGWCCDKEAYPKDEADKVIAEKDKQIDLYKRGWEESDRINEHLYAQLRHSNHKRCLAMAAVCFEKSYSTTLVKYDKESGLLRNFYDWWGKRWLELAEEPTWAKFLQLIHTEEK